MFPYLKGALPRFAKEMGETARTWPFRIAIAVLFAALHLAMFARAGTEDIDAPFNGSPNEAPYYSDVHVSAVRGYPRQPHHWSRLVTSRWDAQHYIGFALRGLEACPDKPDPENPEASDLAYLECGLGWLPAFGVAGGAVSRTFGLPVDFTLMGIAVLAAILVNLLWTARLFTEKIGVGGAYATLIAFNLYPSAFYLVAPYAESTTLALMLGAFLAFSADRWILAGILIGASTALKASAAGFALALGVAALLAAWSRRKEAKPGWWKPLVAIPLAGWGMLVQLILLQVYVGDWSAYIRARKAFGDDRDYTRLIDPEFYVKGFSAQHMDSVMLVGVLAILLATARGVLKKFTREQAWFLSIATGTTMILGVAAVHEYWGINRYLLMCPLAFLGLAQIARQKLGVYLLWLFIGVSIYWYVELCSYVAQGHPGICPCLGRVEFAFPFGS